MRMAMGVSFHPRTDDTTREIQLSSLINENDNLIDILLSPANPAELRLLVSSRFLSFPRLSFSSP